MANIGREQFAKNSVHMVDVTYIVNPHYFYTRLTKYRVTVQNIEETMPLLYPLSIDVNDVVIFNLNSDTENPKYARGLVKHIEKVGKTIRYTLFALDYGYEKYVSPNQIWECDEVLSDTPPLALCCKLSYCEKRGKDWGEAIQAFKEYVGTEPARMHIQDITRTGLIVALYNTCPSDLATLLAITNYTTLGMKHNELNVIEHKFKELEIVDDYKFNKYKIGEKLHVRVLSGKSLDAFYVAEVNDYRNYLEKREEFSQLTKKEALIDETRVKCGDVVCVKDIYDKTFKRGIVKEINNDTNQARIQLVDLGKEEVLGVGKLRRVPQKYLSLPVVGIFCSTSANKPETDVRIILHPGQELLITVKGLGHQFETAHIVDIDKIML